MNWIGWVGSASILAGLVQGITGFGAGIVMMVLLPQILPIGQSAGVSTVSMIIADMILVWRYRSALKLHKIIGLLLLYAGTATWSVHLSVVFPIQKLKLLLGLLLILISSYHLYVSTHEMDSRRLPTRVGYLFSGISGFFSGLFGIGGPLMALFFLMRADSKEEYLATIQTFFLLNVLYTTTLRFGMHVLTLADIKYILIGMIGAVIGTLVANRVTRKLDGQQISIIVYIFILISGIYYVVIAT